MGNSSGMSSSSGCMNGMLGDQQNCGVCGHSCGPGMCVGVECQSYQIGPTLGVEPISLAVNSQSLFAAMESTSVVSMMGNGQILRFSLSPMADSTTLAANISPLAVAADDKAVYWLDKTTTVNGYQGILYADPMAMGDKGKPFSTLPWIPDPPRSLLLLGDTLLYTVDAKAQFGMVKTDDTDSKATSLQSTPQLFTADSEGMYYYDGAAIWHYSFQSKADAIFIKESNVTSLAVDADQDGYVYWTALDDLVIGKGRIKRANKVSKMEKELAMDSSWPKGIMADSQFVYWSENGQMDCKSLQGTIYRIALTPQPGNLVPVATDVGCPAMTQDASHIYWTVPTQILARTKP